MDDDRGRANVQSHGCRRAAGKPIAGDIGEAVGPGIAGVRRVGERTIGVQRQASVRWRAIAGQSGGKGQAVVIDILGQDTLGGAFRDGAVGLDPIGAGRRGRRRRPDVQRDRDGRPAAQAVAGYIGEAVGSRKAGDRRIGEGAIGVERQGSVGRPAIGRQRRRQGHAVVVDIIGQDALRGRLAQARARLDGIGVRHGGRSGRAHGQSDGGRGSAAGKVAGDIGEAVGADIAGGRRVGERTVGVQHQRAVRRPAIGGQRRAERQAVVVGVIGQHTLGGVHGQG